MDVDFHLIVPQSSSHDDNLYAEWKLALDHRLSATLRQRFSFVRSRLDDLPETRFDAIVSPANSYGRLDGAFDAAISRLLSPPDDYHALTRHVQQVLYNRWRGFQPPGTASVVSLPPELAGPQVDKTGCKYVIICPTMHWPQDIRWNHDVVYNTVWALLAEVDRYNREASQNPTLEPIRSILMPGLGTGTGRIPAARFTAQFALAVRNFDDAMKRPDVWRSLKWNQVEGIIADLRDTFTAGEERHSGAFGL